jgi:hypothetical protein
LSGNYGLEDPTAFVTFPKARDELAEAFGEGAVLAMTSGADGEQQLFDQVVIEEWGGPFVVSPARVEFAAGPDADDIPMAELSAFPKVI